MSFSGVTFSGPDETVSPNDLEKVKALYFRIEWGLLFSLERQGREPRYPSTDWMLKLNPILNVAGHLSGQLARDFLRGEDSELLKQYPQIWSKIRHVQINLDATRQPVDIPRLGRLIDKYSDKEITIQVHGQNLELAEALSAQKKSCSILFERTGGGGIFAENWPRGLKHFSGCGYAGGLAPENIYKQIQLIFRAAQPAQRWWIDMESSLRKKVNGKDVFSLENCTRTIREIESYFLNYAI